MYYTVENRVLVWSWRLILLPCRLSILAVFAKSWLPWKQWQSSHAFEGDRVLFLDKMYNLSCNSTLGWQMVLWYVLGLRTSSSAPGMQASDIYFVFLFWFVPKFILLTTKWISLPICCSASNSEYSSRPASFIFVILDYHRAGRQNLTSNPNLSIGRKIIHGIIPPWCRILLWLKTQHFGPKLILQPPFNSSLEFLLVDIPVTQPKQPLRVTYVPVFISFYLTSWYCATLVMVCLAKCNAIKGFFQCFIYGKQQ